MKKSAPKHATRPPQATRPQAQAAEQESVQVAVVEVNTTLHLVFPTKKLSEGLAEAERFMDELLAANQEVIKGAMIHGFGTRAEMVPAQALQQQGQGPAK